LSALLDLPWMSLEGKGAIFLRQGQGLRLVVGRYLDEPLQRLCARVPLGRCLCGRVGLSGKALVVQEVGEAHEIRYPGMPPHGHAIYPLKVGERVLGVLTLYLPPGRLLSAEEAALLETAAGLLALAVLRERAERAARVVRRAALALWQASDERAFLQEVCSLLVDEGYLLAWVGEALPGGQVRVYEGAGAVGYLEGLLVRWDETPEGQGPTGRAIRSGESQVLRDVEGDPRYGPWRNRAQAFGFASSAALPLRVENRVWGALNVYAPESDAFDAEELSLLRTLAQLVSRGLERFRIEAKVHLLAQVVEEVPESIFLTDLEGRIFYANPAACRRTGYTLEELLGQNPRLFKSGKNPQTFYQELWETLRRGEIFQGVFWNRSKTGRILVEHKILTPIRDDQGQVIAFASTGREITREYMLSRLQGAMRSYLEGLLREGVQAHGLRGLLREVLEAVPGAEMAALLLKGKDGLFSFAELVGEWDPRWKEWVLPPEALAHLSQYGTLSQLELERLAMRLPEETRALVVNGLGTLKDAVYVRLERGGETRGFLVVGSYRWRMAPEVEEALRFLAVEIQGVLEWEEAQVLSRWLSLHDPVTGLPNRTFLEMEHAKVRGPLGFFLLELEGVSEINQTHGRAAGDEVLRILAGRFQTLLPPEGKLYRTGEVELLFILPVEPVRAVEFYQRLKEALNEPVYVANEAVRLGGAVSAVFAPEDGQDMSSLLRRADLALRRAKREGGLAFFNPVMEEAHRRRQDILSGLEAALRERGLRLFAQPIVDVPTGRTLALELLLRWPRKGEFVPASEFIPLAEETGLVVELDLYVLREIVAWPELGTCLHVNVSARTLHDERLLAALEALRGRRLRLEVTEYTLADAKAEQVLERIKAMGFGLALDDFGQGFASLRSLIRFPFSVVKVDRAFTWGIGKDPKAEVALRSILSLTQELGLLVVAEGVETEAQRTWLLEAGYPLAQGYLLGRPEPLEFYMDSA